VTLAIFPGQGVKHPVHGYGAVVFVDHKARKAGVKFRTDEVLLHYEVVSFDQLGPATMAPIDFESMQKKIKSTPDERGSRTLIEVHDVANQMTVKSTADSDPPADVRVPSADGSMTGGKCAHGVYIAPLAGSQSIDCTICHPLEIRAKEKSTFKA